MWKVVKDFPYYEVNEHGEIRTVSTKRMMKPQYDKDGYQYVKLYDTENKTYKHWRVHRLVLETFLRPPLEGEECHHINEIRDDNNLTNLCWVTRQENDSYVQHKVNSGSYPEVPVYQLDLNGNIIGEFKSMSEAHRQTGCSVSKISLVCSGKRHTTGGYRWITQ